MAERLYYTDSFLQIFPAQVTDIREVSRTDGVSIWQLALDRSAFYPTSGGQPFDRGVLKAVSRNGAVLEVPIEEVEEGEDGEVWHLTRKPLTSGTKVEGAIEWSRRLDHMQQHSGQHLLSAVFHRELQAETVSFHLGESISTIDLAVDALAIHSIERVERVANELIAEDRSVTVMTVSHEEAEGLLAAGRLRKLPPREGSIRVIEIADYDLNACGGTHVRSLGQIGSLLIRGVEKVSRGFRVEFACGLRAVAAARRDFTLLGSTAGSLSVGSADVPEAIARLQRDAKAVAKDRTRVTEELAGYHAARLAVEEMIEKNLRLVQRTFTDRDPDYVRLLASKLAASVPRTVAVLASDPGGEAIRLVLARSKDVDFHCGNFLREALAQHGVRGGGSPDMAQGDVPRLALPLVMAKMAEDLRNSLSR
ncbi:alanyl-tRNA editing protein [Silvibacterium acidisoli]|uniref:alanyl-tRNA editing protein n=1 Tax=Acidobacteriaceae bacterium ZG23-2 TaxID=2883246 RepID=UPI00406C837C